MIKEIIAAVALCTVIFTGGYFFGKNAGKKTPTVEYIEKEVIVKDSSVFIEPEPITKYINKIVEVPVEKVVTKTIRDTAVTYVYMPIEVKEYTDSTFYARISGVNPNLEEIRTFNTTKYITDFYVDTSVKKFIELEGNAMYDKSFLTPITVNYGIGNNNWEAKIGAGYDPITKSPVIRLAGGIRFEW